ncbi:DUF4259 domain-containing protein [Corynebacterium epidermidicanis]|uniref:Putative DUF4259 family protein n=1 Tax=Corynebacterium epidermidicanis TaxID=1050174 RepID=A0A0G3GPL5_9CORY|nr:DUF4259 domain-containing protein [Corynebacterium epidermidicanis]AKK02530.1 putative DUF4259 family protein [Corynebacterium epidermidicanis]
MGAWDVAIFTDELNSDFLDDLTALDAEDIVEAVEDAVNLVAKQDHVSDEEKANGLLAATIAAIWAGAPFTAGEIAENYPFVRELIGEGSAGLRETAATVLEDADTEEDLEVYLEALA